MPHLKKAELIEGVVHVPSPVRCEHHDEPHLSLGGWLLTYRARTPGVRGADNASVRWLDPAALLRDDLARLLDVLQRGLDSPEHAEFAARLRQARAEPAG
jgi:hypothetical protein